MVFKVLRFYGVGPFRQAVATSNQLSCPITVAISDDVKMLDGTVRPIKNAEALSVTSKELE
jgi:hypothetical protein